MANGDDTTQQAIDFLGRATPLSLLSRPALPTGAVPVPAGGRPVVAGGTPGSPAAPGKGGGGATGGGPPDVSAMQALGVGSKALDVARRLFEGGAETGAINKVFETPFTSSTGGTPMAPPEAFEPATGGAPMAVESPSGEVVSTASGTTGSEAGGVSGAAIARGAGAAAGLGMDLANIPSKWSTGDQVAMGVLDALKAVGNYASFGISALLDAAIQLFGGPSSSEFLADVFGLGPSKSWTTFPQRVMSDVTTAGNTLSDAATRIAAAKTPDELQTALDQSNQHIKGMPGTWGKQSIETLGDFAASMSKTDVHGVPLPDLSAFSTAAQRLRELIASKRAVLAQGEPVTPRPGPPPVDPNAPAKPGGPSGFAGRTALNAADLKELTAGAAA
jgi:hypothetical protein